MKLSFALAGLALAISSTGFAAVTLQVPEEIKLVAVNGQEVGATFLRSDQTYALNAGENTISVRYTDYFEHADNSHDVLKSGVVTLNTPKLVDEQTYRLALINAPKNFEEAQKFKDQPIIGLYDTNQQLLVEQAGAKSVATTWITDGLFGKKIDLTTQQEQTTTNQNLIGKKVLKSAEGAASNTVDLELIQLWKKANPSERQKFMSWLATQSQ